MDVCIHMWVYFKHIKKFCQSDRWKSGSYYCSNLDMLLLIRYLAGVWGMQCYLGKWRVSQGQALRGGPMPLNLFASTCGQLVHRETLWQEPPKSSPNLKVPEKAASTYPCLWMGGVGPLVYQFRPISRTLPGPRTSHQWGSLSWGLPQGPSCLREEAVCFGLGHSG